MTFTTVLIVFGCLFGFFFSAFFLAKFFQFKFQAFNFPASEFPAKCGASTQPGPTPDF